MTVTTPGRQADDDGYRAEEIEAAAAADAVAVAAEQQWAARQRGWFGNSRVSCCGIFRSCHILGMDAVFFQSYKYVPYRR